MLELLESLAQRRAIHAQPLGQLALGRKLRARRVLTVQDQRPQLLGDFLGHPLLLDWLEHSTVRG